MLWDRHFWRLMCTVKAEKAHIRGGLSVREEWVWLCFLFQALPQWCCSLPLGSVKYPEFLNEVLFQLRLRQGGFCYLQSIPSPSLSLSMGTSHMPYKSLCDLALPWSPPCHPLASQSGWASAISAHISYCILSICTFQAARQTTELPPQPESIGR